MLARPRVLLKNGLSAPFRYRPRCRPQHPPLYAPPPVSYSGAGPGPCCTKEEKIGELVNDDEALFRYEDRSYRVRGLKKALRSGGLSVSVEARREGDLFASPSPLSGWFLDRFDFVSSRQRTLFEKQASHEMGVKADIVRWDLGRILRSLEELQRKALAEALKPSTPVHVITEEERAEALELLERNLPYAAGLTATSTPMSRRREMRRRAVFSRLMSS